MLASKEKMLCDCSVKQTQLVDDWILLHLTGKLPNKFTWFFHLPEHLISQEPLINKTPNLWQTDGDWQIKHEGKHKNNYFDVIMLLKREGEGKYKRGAGVKERERELERNWFESNINHWDERRHEKRRLQRWGDRELFDEFMWVRSWVAWSQGLTVGKKAERSILIDILPLQMEDPSFVCVWGCSLCL